MNYEITSLEGSGKEIIQRVMNVKASQLLIPKKLEGMKRNRIVKLYRYFNKKAFN